MPRFRPRAADTVPPPPDLRDLFDDLFAPKHFYIGPDLRVIWQRAIEETIPWEIYQGRLLDSRQTRQQGLFTSWNLVEQSADGPAAAPLVSLKWDVQRGHVHIVRGLLSYVWESYDANGNVIESRETTRWVSELVGTLSLDEFNDTEELRDELICRLWQAVVGTSRLPLTSLEAPLPAFALGQLAYVYRSGSTDAEAMRNWRELIAKAWSPHLAKRELVKLVETALRAAMPSEVGEAALLLGKATSDLPALLRGMFNDVSLSPWTGFVDNVLAFVQALVQHGPWSIAEEVDFFSWLLRQLCRHLTAYDLVTFHHRGANYPDALLLDLVLKRYLQLVEQKPELFAGPRARDSYEMILRRRALRQGALVRRSYEGHAVPDAPTSLGENTRVLPAPFTQVPGDQIANPLRRQKELFADDPLAFWWSPTSKQILRDSFEDLLLYLEMYELGKATYIDRPLGFGKELMEPDQTPLLAHEVSNYDVQMRRKKEVLDLADNVGVPLPEGWHKSWSAFEEMVPWDKSMPAWVPITECVAQDRPVAQLTDAARSSDSASVLRTLPGSLRKLQELFDWDPLNRRFQLDKLWKSVAFKCIRTKTSSHSVGIMALWSHRIKSAEKLAPSHPSPVSQIRVLFESDPTLGFRCRGGVELPVAGLRIWLVVDDVGVSHDLRGEEVHVLPRW